MPIPAARSFLSGDRVGHLNVVSKERCEQLIVGERLGVVDGVGYRLRAHNAVTQRGYG
jgi:hypothetical protein